jgi:glutathione S-transferase
MKLKLISFPICPYVQKCIITLNFKRVKFEVEYIDVDNKPEWFKKISPLEKVPVLIVNNTDILFESNVINEFLDEIYPPKTLNFDILKKAKERAWIEYSGTLLADIYKIITSDKKDPQLIDQFITKLVKIENVIDNKGYFKGSFFSIIDSAYAPIFFRMQLFPSLIQNDTIQQAGKLKLYMQNMLDNTFVKNSVPNNFEEEFLKYLQKKKSWLLAEIFQAKK